jgi:hypothetical protein
MLRRLALIGLAAVFASSIGCSKDDEDPANPVPPSLTALPTTVPADGVASTTITVTAGAAPFTLVTSRGTFQNGETSVQVAQVGGSAILTPCDADVVPACAGPTLVTAAGGDGGVNQVVVLFQGSEICNNGADDNLDGARDCADSQCPQGSSCGASGLQCGATGQCNQCSGNGGAAEPAGELSCTDGFDNDCDGKIDCEDPSCDGRLCDIGNGAAGACAAGICQCKATEANETTCFDGVDQDCDSRIDCADPDCQARGGNLGRVCDVALSLTCSAPDGAGNATCSYCPGQQTSGESSCNDQVDNDCDGFVDCEDDSCADQVCGIANRSCDPTTKLCACPTGLTTETACGDGADEDCDGQTDCADPDCQLAGGQSCGAFGLRCGADGCACPGEVEVCTASGDEDCDGLAECADPDCQPVGNAFGEICDATGHTCSPPALATGISTCSTCPGGQAAEASCFDGKDNDCDGRIDCQDADCGGQACSATGHTCNAQLACSCAGGELAETTCGDGQDNDCDGKADCADPDCTTRSCGANGLACTGGANPTCACSGNGGVAQASESACADGRDNDCDGLADCADTTCQPVGNALGAICDASGKTCSVNLGAGSSCTVCSGNGGRAEAAEASCGDGFDNDCDGIIDCQDADCADVACTAAGKTCDGAARLCRCDSPEAGAEASCDDGQDNDCDGKIDCADEDCAADTCAANGYACAGSSCACTGNGGAPETAETRCGDGADNDCDGAHDCADLDCRPSAGQTYGRSCDTGTSSGLRCDASATCVCSGNGGLPEATESTCGDGFDNDCDGRIDCQDADCQPGGAAAASLCDGKGNTCSAAGRCDVCSGNGGAAEASEATCDDSRDNDCDGKADCDDDQCANQSCSAVNPALLCLASGSPPVATCTDVTSMYSVSLAATRTRIPADGVNGADVTATFRKSGVAVANATCTFGPAARFAAPLGVLTNAAGQASHRFTSDPNGGTATVTVSCTDGIATVAGTLAIDQPRLGGVRVVSEEFNVLGARSSGFQERSYVTFQVVDSLGQPYPENLAVAFTHVSQGGSFLGDVASCSGTPPTCTANALTDADGKVRVLVTAGRTFAQLSVRAAATAGAISGSAVSGNMAVVGAKASGARISLDCSPHNVPALTRHDCTNSYLDQNITCTASFADRHGIVLGVPTVVEFKSEAGAVSVPSTTPAYDGTTSGASDLGYARGAIAVFGHALPADVDPIGDEHNVEYDAGCGTRFHNPRDGVSTIIVMAVGEEGFVDLDGDGERDAGEPFIDLGEPYLDVNDDGQWNPNEWFQDTNLNFTYDGPDGEWNDDTVIWAQTRVVYTGYAMQFLDPITFGNAASRWYQAGAPPAATVQPTFSLVKDGSTTRGLFFTDENFNVLVPATSYAGGSNSDDVSATIEVFATTVFPGLAADMGLTYRTLYCDAEDPAAATVCAGGTPEIACTTEPCYAVPDVGLCASGTCNGFTYGRYGAATINCTDVGGGSVSASATVEGIKTTVSISGTCTAPPP